MKLTPRRRAWLYRVSIAAIPLGIALGWLDTKAAALAVPLLVALLNVPHETATVEIAFDSTSRAWTDVTDYVTRKTATPSPAKRRPNRPQNREPKWADAWDNTLGD